MNLEEIRRRLDETFPAAVLESSLPEREASLTLAADTILPVCRFLRDELHFNFLTDLCGLDRHPLEPRFGVVYHLCAMQRRERLRLKILLPGPDPRTASVSPVWKAANWLEREAFDMYGIHFEGHPDLRRILTPPGFEHFPLRKDFSLREE